MPSAEQTGQVELRFPELSELPPIREIEFDPHGLTDSWSILRLYSIGWFPVASDSESQIVNWLDPEERAILPLGGLRISRSLARSVRRARLQIRVNHDFSGTIRGCAKRQSTWINEPIVRAFCDLHELGFAHSVETWDGERLVGGLYGLSIGRVFFGESMFNQARDASKIALVHLVARLNVGKFRLLDTQFPSDHLKSLGVEVIPKNEYLKRVFKAVGGSSSFLAMPDDLNPQEILQLSTQTSYRA